MLLWPSSIEYHRETRKDNMEDIIETLKALPIQIARSELDLARSTLLLNDQRARMEAVKLELWREIQAKSNGHTTELAQEIDFHDLKLRSESYMKALYDLRLALADHAEDDTDTKCAWASLRAMEAIAKIIGGSRND